MFLPISKLASGLLSGIGSILVLIGAIGRSVEFLIAGGVFVVVGEALDLVAFWHEDHAHKQEFKRSFLKHVGATLALPALLLLLLLISPGPRDAGLTLAILILAVFKSVSIIIKATASD